MQDLVGNLRNVVPSVGFASDDELAALELRVERQPLGEEVVVDSGGFLIVPVCLGARAVIGESNARRRLEEQDIGNGCPSVGVSREAPLVML